LGTGTQGTFGILVCRIHQTLRVTPAMEAGVTNKLWEVEDIVALID